METRVVHCKKEPYNVYIGRPSKWGNPFTHIADRKTKAEFIVSTRKEAIEKYREWILNKPELLNDLHELKGKTLACWCMPINPKPGILYCHGQILVELIEKLCKDKEEDE
jgi:hypothetical protein